MYSVLEKCKLYSVTYTGNPKIFRLRSHSLTQILGGRAVPSPSRLATPLYLPTVIVCVIQMSHCLKRRCDWSRGASPLTIFITLK